VLALPHGLLPPTINELVPDPGCDLDHNPNVAREQVDAAPLELFRLRRTRQRRRIRRWAAD